MPLFTHRGCECIMDRPVSTNQSRAQSIVRNSISLGQRNERYALSFVLDQSRNPRISVLFTTCRPTTVLWAIVTFVVDAIKGMVSRWWFSYILNKRLQRIQPAIADLNPASSIPFVRRALRIRASFDHIGPRNVDLGFSHSVGSVPRASMTAATRELPVLQVASRQSLHLATVTATEPHRLSRARTIATENKQLTKSIAGQVCMYPQLENTIGFSHVRLLVRRMWLEAAERISACAASFILQLFFCARNKRLHVEAA